MFELFKNWIVNNVEDYDEDSFYLCEDGITFMFKKKGESEIFTVIYDIQKGMICPINFKVKE